MRLRTGVSRFLEAVRAARCRLRCNRWLRNI